MITLIIYSSMLFTLMFLSPYLLMWERLVIFIITLILNIICMFAEESRVHRLEELEKKVGELIKQCRREDKNDEENTNII